MEEYIKCNYCNELIHISKIEDHRTAHLHEEEEELVKTLKEGYTEENGPAKYAFGFCPVCGEREQLYKLGEQVMCTDCWKTVGE